MKLLDKIAASNSHSRRPQPAPVPPAEDAEREREHVRTIEAIRDAEISTPRPFMPDPMRGEGARDPRANVLADTILTVHLKGVAATRAEIDRLLAQADQAMDNKTYRDLMIRVAATAQEIAARIDRVRLR